MRDRRLLVLSPYPQGCVPGQRFRIEQWEGVLEERGISVSYLPFADADLMGVLFRPGRTFTKIRGVVGSFLRQWRDLPHLERPDAAFVYRSASLAGPPLVERWLARRRIPFVMDFDDAIFMLHSAPANRYFSWLKFPGKTAEICRRAEHVTVGNTYLRDWARQHNQAVSVVPSSVDLRTFRESSPEHRSRVVVGWTGSHTSQSHLERVAPMLARFFSQNTGASLRVHSDKAPTLPGVPFEWRPWRPDTEAAEIGDFDIGIMPMPDDPWSRGKCSMKALLYMASGRPAVCSAVGNNVEVIESGVNGVLATTDRDWIDALTKLVADAGLRTQLGHAGRLTVERDYSREVCGGRLASVVEGVFRES